MLRSPFVYWDLKIEKLALDGVGWIRNNKPDAASVAVLKFALKAYINFFIIAFFTILVATITGNVIASIAALLSFPLLRYFSGGIHLSSSSKCAFLSAIIVAVCVYTPITYWYNGIILTALSALILVCFAPSGIKQSKMPKSQYPFLKVAAVLIVCSNFIFHSPVLSIAFFAQSITTIPVFEKWLDRLNL